MEWLVAVVLRPLGSLVLLSIGALVAYKVLGPAIPAGRFKSLLFDRTFRHRHPWLWGVAVVFGCYGTLGVLIYIYR